MSDFLEDSLEKDDGRGKARGLHQVHLETMVSIGCTEEGEDDLRQKYVGVREDIVAGRELFVRGIACSGQDGVDCTSADPTRDDATVYIITEVALSYYWWRFRCMTGRTVARKPLMTLPRDVFLKNLRRVTSASSRGRFRIVI